MVQYGKYNLQKKGILIWKQLKINKKENEENRTDSKLYIFDFGYS